MPNNAKRVTRDARVRKMRAGHLMLMRSIWAKKLSRAALEKTRVVSKSDIQDDERGKSPPMPTAEKLAEVMPPATEASLAPATSSTTTSFLPPPDKPWKKVYENLRVMDVGEPGRLALLASTYSSAESRSRLTKPGEPEMTWEEVKAAVRESPPLKRKLSRDVDDTEEESPRPAKMGRFEERTARVKVYDLPKNPFTTYHPTKPRRTHALPMDDEEELHCRKKRRLDGPPPSIFGPKRTHTGDLLPSEPAVTSAMEPSSQPTNGSSKLSIPACPSCSRAANSDKQGDLTLVSWKWLQYSRARGRNYLRWIRRQSYQSPDQRLVNAMAESDRFLQEVRPIKHTGTRPPSSLHNDDSNRNVDEDKKVSSPPVYKGDQNEPSHTTIEKITQGGDEAIRQVGLGTAEKEVVQAQRAAIKKEREVFLIKMRKRFSRAPPGKGSPLKRSESVSVSVSVSDSNSDSNSDSDSKS